MTTPHPHAEFLHALADGRGDEFECHHENWHASEWCCGPDYVWVICEYPDSWTVRRKPRTIRIGDIDVPPPMRVAPAMGTAVWLVCIHTDPPYSYSWSGNTTEQGWLKLGICHLAKEAAEQQRKALILVSGGTP